MAEAMAQIRAVGPGAIPRTIYGNSNESGALTND
jgi:hypothetical protein